MEFNASINEPKAPLFERHAYQLNGVTYLPHYTKNVFVGPGYPLHNEREYTAGELEQAGAVKVKTFLFARGPKAAGKVEEKA